jgi:hypothetical protein
MSNNFEYHRWLAHANHKIEVEDVALIGTDYQLWHKEVRIVCHDCKANVEVWEFIPEYEGVNNV